MPTLHLLGVPHTVPNEDFAVCAYTNKLRVFPSVLKPFGWRAILYANEGKGEETDADEYVVILPKDEFARLSKRKSRDDDHSLDVDNKSLHDAFHRALLPKILARAKAGDLVGHLWGPSMGVYNALRDCHHIELCVGYSSSPGLPFRVYETSAWRHWHDGKTGRDDGEHYKFAIPSPIDTDRWRFCAEPENYLLYFGRITPRKGMDTLVEIARRMPDREIRAYGPGDQAQWTKQAPSNLSFHGPVFGDERVEVVRRARCQLMPTVFIEPFGNSGVEGQLSGVPLIGVSYGAFTETIDEGVNGFRCHTLADWIEAIRLSSALDRRRISDLAHQRYSKEAIGRQYDAALRQIADLSGRGWYSAKSRKFAKATRQRRIWLYIPWFGPLPNYFQLYLDSLGRNANLLTVFLLTDVDLSSYRLPENLIPIATTIDELRVRLAVFLAVETTKRQGQEFGLIEPPALIQHLHKLTDFKILYPALFNDKEGDDPVDETLRGRAAFDAIADKHGVTENDFVGWGDLDVIYGQLSDFLDLEDCYIVGGLFGHFTALRNTGEFRELFRQVPNLPAMLTDEKNHVIDEIAFRKVLLKFCTEPGQIARIDRYFCDVIPQCFFNLFPQHTAEFFDSTHPEKELRHIHSARDGQLTVTYQDGTTRPAIYCHMQKRAMELPFEDAENGYYIGEHAFSLEAPKAKPILQDLAFESRFWGDCANINTYNEETKQFVYARLMGLASFDAGGKRILDIGGGPVSMMLKMKNLKEGKVVDPLRYPDWTVERYKAKNIAVEVISGEDIDETGFDEAWIYNCLQHVVDPELVIKNARRAAPVLRIFEWIDVQPYIGHPHLLTETGLNEWLGRSGKTIELNESGCIGRAFYGCFETVKTTGAAA